MSNVGTTATISPDTAATPVTQNVTYPEIIQESDMDNALGLFERMANSVVNASKLVPVVQGLMRDVQALKQDIDHVREQNSRLDEMLTETRKQREELRSELSGVRTELHGAQEVNRNLHVEVEQANERINRLVNELDTSKQESQGWMEAALKADHQRAEAEDKLDKLQKTFRTVFGVDTPPSTPYPEPVNIPITESAKLTPNAHGIGPDTAPSAAPQSALHTEPKADEPKSVDEAKSEPKPWQPKDQHERYPNW